MYDVIIVGGASAGLTAGIYASRRKMKTLIITKDVGGQANMAHTVENYPGFLKVGGVELMQKFYEHAVNSGAEVIFNEVSEISEKNGNFIVKAGEEKYETKTVILAFGKTPRSLGIPGEKEFQGKGVSYCATCDMPLFKDKVIAVVGGGNSALDAAMYGSDIAKKVYLIHRRDKFRGFETLVKDVEKKENIELILDSVTIEIKGEKFVKSLIVKNKKTEEKKELGVDGIFIEIGSEIKTDLIKDFVKLDEYNQIVVTKNCETFYPDSDKIRSGVFAAGDVTDVPIKQIIVSGGEGCKAALNAYNFIHGIKPTIIVDWAKQVGK